MSAAAAPRIAAAALAFTAAGFAAVPANALSCLRPDPVSLYEQARDSDKRFRVVHGALQPLEKVREQRARQGQRETPPITVKARLQGLQLGADGFATPFDRTVSVELVCFSAWCGQFPGTDQQLLAVEERGEGFVVTSDPCSSLIYSTPTAADLKRVIDCHDGGTCATARN